MTLRNPLLLLAISALAACVESPPEPEEIPIGLANPAAVYCIKQGGRLETRTEAAGEASYCHLPDGRVIEEWQLYRDNSPL